MQGNQQQGEGQQSKGQGQGQGHNRRRFLQTSMVMTAGGLMPLGATHRAFGFFAANAHTVAVDSRTHRVYWPLQDVGGKPVLRITVASDAK